MLQTQSFATCDRRAHVTHWDSANLLDSRRRELTFQGPAWLAEALPLNTQQPTKDAVKEVSLMMIYQMR